MFKSDQAIQSKNEDILNRASFSQAMGQAILDYKERDSLVLGLFGEWGSGKTSIINMALEYIASTHEEQSINENKPIIINFNPWNFSNQNQLITQFFRELSVALKRADYAAGAKDIGEKLEIYARFFEPLILIPNAGPVFAILSTLFRSSGKGLKGWGDKKSKDLDAIKNELNELLDKQMNKVIIVIDDIDRLSDNEIGQMFQLVKSLGDFHNTIYVLAFDKKVVVSALERLQYGFGMQYLEKVVQVPFEIPLMPNQELQRFLTSQIDMIIEPIPQERWDNTRWGNLYFGGIRHFFENIRDVIRYINSLKFNLNLVKDEINVVDFLALTVIQVFTPEVYYGIKNNKLMFTGTKERSYLIGTGNAQDEKNHCDSIIAEAKNVSPEIIRGLLKLLFPRIDSIYNNISYSSDSLSDWRKELRICSPDIFDIYFMLSVLKDDISNVELKSVMKSAITSTKFAKELLRLSNEGKIRKFLDRFEDHTSSTPEQYIEPVILALIDVGDLFPEEDTGRTWIDTTLLIHLIIRQLLHRFKDQEQRYQILQKAIKKSKNSLYVLVNEVSANDHEHGKYNLRQDAEPEEKRTVDKKQLEQLEIMACQKIIKWVKEGRLQDHKNLSSILFAWKRWGNIRDINNFIEKMIKDDNGLIDFVNSFLSKYTSSGMSDHISTTHWYANLESISEFLDLNIITPRVRNIALSPDFHLLSERKKFGIQIFLDTVDGKIINPLEKVNKNSN